MFENLQGIYNKDLAMENVRKIVREQLEKALREAMFITPQGDIQSVKTDDDLILNFTQGRDFAYNKLQDKIQNLDKYELIDYFPKGENSERWSFETPLPYGGVLLVDIEHTVNDKGSLWNLQIGKLYKGEELPDVVENSGPIKGYDNFIRFANSEMSKYLEPNRF
jgi:hypothetical protein